VLPLKENVKVFQLKFDLLEFNATGLAQIADCISLAIAHRRINNLKFCYKL
jgi:hypothetical protein